MFFGEKSGFQARTRTDSLSGMVQDSSDLPLGQGQIFNHILKLVQADSKNKLSLGAELFSSRSAAAVL